jgi:hypothetical protein
MRGGELKKIYDDVDEEKWREEGEKKKRKNSMENDGK